ncbi:MAG UNVERIFIED_CONTAM: hypothetical protein LVR18_48955 [Planctomycetaceae bacterium]
MTVSSSTSGAQQLKFRSSLVSNSCRYRELLANTTEVAISQLPAGFPGVFQ